MFIFDLLYLIRVKDWLKNIIIFFPLIFSGYLFNYSFYFDLFIGFIAFSIVASSIYVLNDIIDINKDRLHPTKKFSKPLACKKISIKIAYLLLFLLIIFSCFLIYFHPVLYSGLIAYIIINLSYNFGFKNIPYLEFILLAFGYVIRINTGSNIIQVDSSILMLTSIFFVGIFFILLKRVGELNHNNNSLKINTRSVLKYYDLNNLKLQSFFSIVLISIILLIYIITININLILSFVLTVYFLYKYYLITKDSSEGENPITFILSNRILLILSFIILLSFIIIYI